MIVEPPRSLPLMVSMAAATKPAGSKPEFSQNVLSSIDVVASIRAGGMSSNVTTSRRSSPSRASWTLPDAVVHGRLLGEAEVVEGLLGVLEIAREVRVGGHRCGGAGDAEQGDDGEQDQGDRDGDGLGRGRTVPAGAAAVTEPATPLPPEAGLHVGREDTMRGMDARSSRSGRTNDGSGPQPVTSR